MKHFVGGSGFGMLVALMLLPRPKPITEMGDLEFWSYLGAHVLFAAIVGSMFWGFLP